MEPSPSSKTPLAANQKTSRFRLSDLTSLKPHLANGTLPGTKAKSQREFPTSEIPQEAKGSPVIEAETPEEIAARFPKMLAELSETDGVVQEIDVQLDPPEEPPRAQTRECNYKTMSRLVVWQNAKVPEEDLRQGVREVLSEMSQAPKTFKEMSDLNEEFLNSIEEKILDYKKFIAGSFGNSYPAWEMLLRDSKMQSSKTSSESERE